MTYTQNQTIYYGYITKCITTTLQNVKYLQEDYDCTINYHPGKANVVAYALGRKERLNLLTLPEELYKEFQKLELKVRVSLLENRIRHRLEKLPMLKPSFTSNLLKLMSIKNLDIT